MSYIALDYINKVRTSLCSQVNGIQQSHPIVDFNASDLLDKEKTAELKFLTKDGLASLFGAGADKHPAATIDAIRHTEEATRMYRDLKILSQSRTSRLLNGLSGLNAQRNLMRFFLEYTKKEEDGEKGSETDNG